MAEKINLQPIEKEVIGELSSFLDLMGIRSKIDPDLDFVVDDLRSGGARGLNIRSRYFKLEGMNIDGLRYTIEQIMQVTGGGYGASDRWRVICEYWVKRDVSGDKKHLKDLEARTKKKKKGLFKSDIIDFKWVGGRIADILSQDTSLNEPLLADLVTAQTKGCNVDIEIEPMPIEQGVRIRVAPKIEPEIGKKQENLPLLLPSKDAFRAYDRIAKHIRDYTIL